MGRHALFLSIVVAILVVAALSSVLPQYNEFAQSHKLNKNKVMRAIKAKVNSPDGRGMSCFACSMMVDGLQTMIKENKTDDEIAAWLVGLCDFFNVEQPHVCKNIIYAFKDEVVFVLVNSAFTPDEICGAFIQNCGHSEPPRTVMWNLTMPGGKPPVKQWEKVQDGKPTLKVLHLSDIHIDHQYQVGTEAYCQLDDFLGTYAMCCRDYTDDVKDSRKKDKPIYVPAGPWGMPYLCDLPYQTFESAMKHINQTVKDLDMIIITGDFEAHDSWDYSEELTIENMNNMTNVFLKYFPGIPVYISIGNHEGVPQDAMAPHTMPEYDKRGPQWLYKIMVDMWSNWISDEKAKADIQYRASYAIYAKPGLKLISINTIYCSEFNFYLYINEVDPDSTLEWLIEELLDSEEKNDRVWIISHIPPGDNYCLKGWSFNFFEIMKRFENIITEQFYGHTHYDQFMVYYDPDQNMRPFSFNWIAPSLTTYAWLHPAYRIYEIDGGYPNATYHVKDAYTYYANVTEANESGKEPQWKMSYNTKAFYQMPDFTPQSWSDLAYRLWNNQTLFNEYIKLFWRNDKRDAECHLDAKCRYSYICNIKKARSYDESFCADLKEQ
ncbi:hypothetical protein WR25_22037 [Diploscapter pachys]|uniref:Sphingomyelin phosphodiesterase n=1 Tax=Diploscapter pachys TaxID=2018661 RepID=A0A2A2J9Z5_9BILA|nr:hypothetical protein WR25_22037 [Diploscapter pachys]